MHCIYLFISKCTKNKFLFIITNKCLDSLSHDFFVDFREKILDQKHNFQ